MTKSAHKVINNTIILYSKMVVSLFLGFFTIRIVLHNLGEVDYGIYTLVAGVVTTFGFLQSVMSNSTLRFLSHSMGSNNPDKIGRTFGTAVYLHALIGVAIVVIVEVGGWFMFKKVLNIPPDRIFAALWTFHLMVASLYITVIAVPYDALMSSHEDFLPLAIIDVTVLILKLIIAFSLMLYKSDLLIFYSSMIFLVTIGMRLAKLFYSKRKYQSIWYNRHFDKRLVKNMLSFSGWILFGTLCSIGSGQVTNIIINMFFGVRLNAANGIATQVRGQINGISVNFTNALLPRLIKNEGRGDRKKMLDLTGVATKFAIYLFSFLSIPVIFELPLLLKIWLVNIPEYTLIFSRLLLIGMLLDKFTFHLGDAIRAVGDIKWYQISESVAILINLPISYYLFIRGFPPQTIYIVPLFLYVIVIVLRFYFAQRIAGLNIKDYILKIIIKALFPILGSVSLLIFIHIFLRPDLIRVFLSFFSSSAIFLIIMVRYGLDAKEKQIIKTYIMRIIKG